MLQQRSRVPASSSGSAVCRIPLALLAVTHRAPRGCDNLRRPAGSLVGGCLSPPAAGHVAAVGGRCDGCLISPQGGNLDAQGQRDAGRQLRWLAAHPVRLLLRARLGRERLMPPQPAGTVPGPRGSGMRGRAGKEGPSPAPIPNRYLCLMAELPSVGTTCSSAAGHQHQDEFCC